MTPKHLLHVLIILFLLLLVTHADVGIRGSNSTGFTNISMLNSVILSSNATIFSPNKTFVLGFFTPNPQLSNYYLGIWYSSLPSITYVWVANRQIPLKNLSSATLRLTSSTDGTEGGRLVLSDSVNFVVWETNNRVPATKVLLLETGNLVLVSDLGDVVWQSFDYPTDTLLPGMNLTTNISLTCWKSRYDPSPGRYSLRIRQPENGELELIYGNTSSATGNGSDMHISYWSTGKWTNSAFSNIPQMTIPYIYNFYFIGAFTPIASFGFTERSLVAGSPAPPSRFWIDPMGLLWQFTWNSQNLQWNTFWSQPSTPCRVYGLCGEMGVCYGSLLSSGLHLPEQVCQCLDGYDPVDEFGWSGSDFSSGCSRRKQLMERGGNEVCVGGREDFFKEIGLVEYDGVRAQTVLIQADSEKVCEKSCLSNCSCIGLFYYEGTSNCKNVFGSLLNLHNSSSDAIMENGAFYLRIYGSVLGDGRGKKAKLWLICTICGAIVMFFFLVISIVGFILRRTTINRRRREEEEAILSLTNLKVFSYKDLHCATSGFSEIVGHGGFGSVFRGILSDSSLVAVKRLERPGGGGEREFRAEVCTIGNIQHVNLVRLRGFCSENPHRLLVYEFMPNGSLSSYLKKGGQNLSWDIRYRVAVGTAKALAYLHEECRNCILHCDIKPENILLDHDYSPKVSDFGLAKLIGRDFSRVLATMRGTWGYVAPEWISGVPITPKADVYSYGMTMLELIGGRRNVEAPPPSSTITTTIDAATTPEGGHGGEKWFFPPWAASRIIERDVEAIVDERLGGAYDRAEVERLGMVAIWCIQDEERERPSMGMVVKMLEGVVAVAVPPPPKLLQALVAGESFAGVRTDTRECEQDNDASISVEDSLPTSPVKANSARSF